MTITVRRARPWAWLAGLALLVPALAVTGSPLGPLPAAAATGPGLTFSATVRASGLDAIFTADADGSNIRQVSPNDGRSYDWGRFAYGNTKIVYTVKQSRTALTEELGLMNVDGTGRRTLRAFDYRILQPVVDRSGRYVHFSAKTAFFPRVSQFRLDLRTDTITNLTAVGTPTDGQDIDPNLVDARNKLLFVYNPDGPGTSVHLMDLDGRNRVRLKDMTWHDTDPTPSRDGTRMAISSYRGEGRPTQARDDDPAKRSTTMLGEYYHITLQDLRPNAPERVLTEGRNCTITTPQFACTVREMSGFQPRFTPDGQTVSFVGALDHTRTCVCAIDTDGTDPRVILESTRLAIKWHEWPQPAGYPTSTSLIGAEKRSSQVVAVVYGPDRKRRLAVLAPDLATRTLLTLPRGLQPLDARWGPGRRSIVFTATVPIGSTRKPHPAPPRGSRRTVHKIPKGAARIDRAWAQRQVFVAPYAGGRVGSVRQLTDAWTEDWRDGLPRGDVRGNHRPSVSPDGRAVYVTNVSTLTGESFLLRIDLATGAVRNLTRPLTSAVRRDADPAVSPNGRRLVFVRSEGKGRRAVFVMDAATGANLRRLRLDATSASMPAWSPDSRYLLYTSARTVGSVIVRSNLTGTTAAGTPVPVSGAVTPATSAVVAPERDRFLFLGPSRGKTSVWTRTVATGPVGLRQPDIRHSLFAVDWR